MGNRSVTVFDWMSDGLGLRGPELIAYAIIYGSSQDGMSSYSGPVSYIAKWSGISNESAMRMLRGMEKKGLITRTEEFEDECIMAVHYTAVCEPDSKEAH